MDAYQFSQLYPGSCVVFSPGSTFLATATEDSVIVRASTTLDPVRTWTCTLPDPSSSRAVQISSLSWSPNGSRLLAQSTSAGVSWVFDLADDLEICRLSGEMTRAEWVGDDVVALSERGLSIYDLSTGAARFVQNAQGFTSSPDQRYLAVAERHQSKEHVGIYDKQSLVRHFPVEIPEMSGISWSPCGKWLALWDQHLSSTLKFYSPVGAYLGEANCLSADIKKVAWAPSGRFIAIGDAAGGVDIIEAESWEGVAAIDQTAYSSARLLTEPSAGMRVEGITQFMPGEGRSSKTPVAWLGFSSDGSTLYHGSDRILRIDDFSFGLNEPSSTPKVVPRTTVVFNSPIRSAEMCPVANRIAVVTGNRSLYLWDTLGVEGVSIPAETDFRSTHLQWAPDGRSVSLVGKSTFCLVYEELPEERNSRWEEDS